MEKKLFALILTGMFITGTVAFAMTIGQEPPESYIKNLKNCQKSSEKIEDSIVSEYTINGFLSDGRCEVIMSSYTNFADPEIYEGYKAFAKTMINTTKKENQKIPEIPTQQQMIAQAQKEKNVTVCKFTQEQIDALYEAYHKKDNKNTCTTTSDGKQSCSFSTANMSSYDKLMMNYSGSTCSTKLP